MTPWIDRLPASVCLGAVILLGAVLYLSTINSRGYSFDEIQSLRDVKRPYRQMLAHRTCRGHTPLYFSGMWLWVRAFGESEPVMRLPATVFGLGCVAVMFLLLDRFGDRRRALLAALLILLNSEHLHLSHMVRPYTLTGLCALLATYWICRKQDDARWRDAAVMAALSAAGLYSHGSAALVLGPQLVYLLARGRRCLPLAVGVGLGAMSFVPWLVRYMTRSSSHDALGWVSPLGIQTLPRLIVKLGLGSQGWVPQSLLELAVPALVMGALGVGGWLALGRLGRLLGWMWIGPVVMALGATLAGMANLAAVSRYFAASAVIQSTLLAAAIAKPWKRFAPARWGVMGAVVIASGAVMAAAVTHPRKPDWRDIAKFVSQKNPQRETIVVLTKFPVTFRYYFKKAKNTSKVLTWRVFDPDRSPTDSQTTQHLQSQTLLAGANLWLVLDRKTLDPGAKDETGKYRSIRYCYQQLMRRYTVTERFSVSRLELMHLSPKSPSGEN